MKIFRKGVERKYEKISELSFDKENLKSLCDYKNRFLNGDKIKNSSIPSVDMIFIHKKRQIICFVEFKNSSYKNLDNIKSKIKLKQKLFGSRIGLAENLIMDIRTFKKVYFVIYNKKIESNLNYFESWADEEKNIEFELQELIKKDFIDDVFTENCDFLKSYFKEEFKLIFY